MIAALYVQTGGCYFGLDGVDPWDEARDARTYAGPWPELERARAHLKECQGLLAMCRRADRDNIWIYNSDRAERNFLAALSWLWEAQEKNTLDTWLRKMGLVK